MSRPTPSLRTKLFYGFGSVAFGAMIGVVLARFLIYVKRGSALFALMICVVVAEIGARIHLDPLPAINTTNVASNKTKTSPNLYSARAGNR